MHGKNVGLLSLMNFKAFIKRDGFAGLSPEEKSRAINSMQIMPVRGDIYTRPETIHTKIQAIHDYIIHKYRKN